MAANQLGVDMFKHIANGKVSFLASDFSVQVDLEQQVAQFVGQLLHVVLFQCFNDLVGLLDHITDQGLVGLLAIPWAAVGLAAQAHGDVA